MTIDQLKDFLSSRPIITPTALEREAGLSERTISKAILGERGISKKAIIKLLPVLKKYGYVD